MDIQLWSPKQLMQRLRDDRMDALPSLILDRWFTRTFYSGDRDILVGELPAQGRKLAPFVLPTEQGKPMVEYKGASVRAITPPYIKPKDVVRIVDARNPVPEEVLGDPWTLQQRFNWRVGEVQNQHVRGIRLQEIWMAARAMIDGAIVVKYQNDQGAPAPEVTINFGRAANQTITLSTTYWDNVDYPILDDIDTWATRMSLAKFGGYPTDILVGASVVPVFKKNKQVLSQMDTTYRGNDVNLRTGIVRGPSPGETLVRLGTVGNGINVWGYRDYVENANGDAVDILDPRDVVFIAPGYEGVRCYGAIYNDMAVGGSAQTDIFPTTWPIHDPSGTVIMHESSPLPYSLYPNRTLKARVLA